MFSDNLIPSATYYIPLLKRMTALNGPIRVTLETEHGEAVEVKAPDGVSARLGVMLEDYSVIVRLGDEALEFRLGTNENLGLLQQADMVAAIKGQLLYAGYDLVEKSKTDDGVELFSVSLGLGSPKYQQKPLLMLWLEAWLAHFEMNAERRKALAIRSAAFTEMDRKREEARRREEEAKQAQKDLETAERETTDADLADADADAFERAWVRLSEDEQRVFGPADGETFTESEKQDVIGRARFLDSGHGDEDDIAA